MSKLSQGIGTDPRQSRRWFYGAILYDNVLLGANEACARCWYERYKW